jgi:thymidine phosphorylase
VRLGAGRETKEDEIDHGVGITLHAKVGDEVSAGAPLATVRYRDPEHLAASLDILDGAWGFSSEPQEPVPLILGEVR